MIGKQINFYLTAADRLRLLKSIRKQVGLMILKRSDTRPYHVSDQLDKGANEWAIEYLCQPCASEKVLNAVSRAQIDASELLAIESILPPAVDGIVQRGRFWYSPRRLDNGLFVPKQEDFVDWASAVFHCAKRELLPHRNGDLIGPETQLLLDSGDLSLSS